MWLFAAEQPLEYFVSNTPRKDQRVTTALLLAAGTGSRLRPLTNNAPKCLTEINGTTILERQVCCLLQHGFKRLVVVVGYLAPCIRKFLDRWSDQLTIDYVESPRYASTNNLYSLWLAREVIREPFLLIESDLIFNASLVVKMLQPNKIAVSRLLPWMRGTTVTINASQQVSAFCVGARVASPHSSYKTVNMYSLSLSSWRRVTERLQEHVSAGAVNEYYETVFANMVSTGSLSLEPVFFDRELWYEVDTLEDLVAAELIFPVLAKRKTSSRALPPLPAIVPDPRLGDW